MKTTKLNINQSILLKWKTLFLLLLFIPLLSVSVNPVDGISNNDELITYYNFESHFKDSISGEILTRIPAKPDPFMPITYPLELKDGYFGKGIELKSAYTGGYAYVDNPVNLQGLREFTISVSFKLLNLPASTTTASIFKIRQGTDDVVHLYYLAGSIYATYSEPNGYGFAYAGLSLTTSLNFNIEDGQGAVDQKTWITAVITVRQTTGGSEIILGADIPNYRLDSRAKHTFIDTENSLWTINPTKLLFGNGKANIILDEFKIYNTGSTETEIEELLEVDRPLKKVDELDLLDHWSPVIYQQTSRGSLIDVPLKVNFDGDWISNNNWESLDGASSSLDMSSTIYYWYMETPDFWYLGYALFHPQDKLFWSDFERPEIFIPDASHENDLEYILMAIHKDENQYGSLVSMETLAHANIFAYTPDGSPLTTSKDRFIESSIEFEVGHPVVYVEDNSHGIYGKEDNNLAFDSTYYDYTWSFDRTNEDWIKFTHDPINMGTKLTSNLVIENTYADYELVSIKEIWDQRFNPQTFVSTDPQSNMFGRFIGDEYKDNVASAPWNVDQDQDYKGAYFYNPQKQFDINFDSSSTKVIDYSYDFVDEDLINTLDYTYRSYDGVSYDSEISMLSSSFLDAYDQSQQNFASIFTFDSSLTFTDIVRTPESIIPSDFSHYFERVEFFIDGKLIQTIIPTATQTVFNILISSSDYEVGYRDVMVRYYTNMDVGPTLDGLLFHDGFAIQEIARVHFTEDQRPNTPNQPLFITGTTNPGIPLKFQFFTTDPDSTSITFQVDWGDGNILFYSGSSGDPLTIYHTYASTGTYSVKARAHSQYSVYSPWSSIKYMTISAPSGGGGGGGGLWR